MKPDKSDATVGELFGALASDTGALVRQEVELAATEMTEKAKTAARNAGFIVAGGALVHVACVAAVVGLILGLSPYVSLWITALCLVVVFAGAGALFVRLGMSRLAKLGLESSDALNALRTDRVWAKEQIVR
jgi:branched-subunit amino acid permease